MLYQGLEIEAQLAMITAEQAHVPKVLAAAQMWGELAARLGEGQVELQHRTSDLTPDWTDGAGNEFAGQVTKSMTTMATWLERISAAQPWVDLMTLATQIPSTLGTVSGIYAEMMAEIAAAQAAPFGTGNAAIPAIREKAKQLAGVAMSALAAQFAKTSATISACIGVDWQAPEAPGAGGQGSEMAGEDAAATGGAAASAGEQGASAAGAASSQGAPGVLDPAMIQQATQGVGQVVNGVSQLAGLVGGLNPMGAGATPDVSAAADFSPDGVSASADVTTPNVPSISDPTLSGLGTAPSVPSPSYATPTLPNAGSLATPAVPGSSLSGMTPMSVAGMSGGSNGGGAQTGSRTGPAAGTTAPAGAAPASGGTSGGGGAGTGGGMRMMPMAPMMGGHGGGGGGQEPGKGGKQPQTAKGKIPQGAPGVPVPLRGRGGTAAGMLPARPQERDGGDVVQDGDNHLDEELWAVAPAPAGVLGAHRRPR